MGDRRTSKEEATTIVEWSGEGTSWKREVVDLAEVMGVSSW